LLLYLAQAELIIELSTIFRAEPMEFEEFRAKYPVLTREQIARVAGCSVALVDRWIMTGKTRKKPSDDHKIRFDIAHWFWTKESEEPSFFEELRRVKRGESPVNSLEKS